MKNKKKKGFLSCINGVRGAISLFLVVLMTPFLTIAMLLVETGRYNQAVSLMDEALGSSSMSALADFDPYLQDRWGLYALNQQSNVTDSLISTMTTNLGVLGDSVTLDGLNAQGLYPLYDEEILLNQLMEYCKLNAPTTLALELLDIQGLFKMLEDKLGCFPLILEMVTGGIDTTNSALTLVEKQETLKTTADTLDGLKVDYDDDYADFRDKTNALITLLSTSSQEEIDLQNMRDELTRLRGELTNLQNNNASEATITAKEQEITNLETDISTQEQTVNSRGTEIAQARTDAENAKAEYLGTLSDIITNLKKFKEDIGEVDEAIEGIQNGLVNAATQIVQLNNEIQTKTADLENKQQEIDSLEQRLKATSKSDPEYVNIQTQLATKQEEYNNLDLERAERETELNQLETAQACSGAMAEDWETSFEDFSISDLQNTISGFEALEIMVNGVQISSITKHSNRITSLNYKNVALGNYIAADEIDEYIEQQENKLQDSGFSELLSGLKTVLNTLFDLNVLFDGKLSANINLDFYDDNVGGLLNPDTGNGIIDILNALKNFTVHSTEIATNFLTFRLKEALKNILNCLNDIKELIDAIISFATKIISIFVDMFTSYERLYLATYCTYNLACRTDYNSTNEYTSFSTMTNYSVKRDSFEKSANSPGGLADFEALIDEIKSYVRGGTNLTFSGAQLEYVLFGSNSEIANQLYVFMLIYLIRAASSIPAILKDTEVKAMAASTTYGAPVVYALYFILEPLVQTVLLVNGNPQKFIPSDVYLSPSGLPKLIQELISFCNMTAAQEQDIKDGMINAISKSRDDYDYQSKLIEYQNKESGNTDKGKKDKKMLKLSYKDYCFAIMMLTVTNDNMLKRLHNLIQMETMYYYRQSNPDMIFDLNKAFTNIRVQANGSVKQLLPSLIDSSRFEVDREIYRGY